MQKISTMTPLFSVLVALLGIVLGVYQYSVQQKQNRQSQEKRTEVERQTAERDFMKPWLQSQRDIYIQVLSAAAMIANTDDPKTRENATDEFWRLYHGRMILVETKSVSGEMVKIGECLEKGAMCRKDELNPMVRGLATTMAESMAETGKMKFEEFAANQFKYR